MENKPRIMVVDDEKIVCDMSKRSFEQEGYHVTIFTDSSQALAALEKERFDVLVTDLKMKEVDGLQLLEIIKKRWPKTQVIILTAFGTMETKEDAFRKQAFDYLTKPVRIKDLVASVDGALNAETDTQENGKHG